MLLPNIKLDDKVLQIEGIIQTSGDQIIQKYSFQKSTSKKLLLEYFIPLLDFQLLWYPSSDGVVFLNNEWDQGMTIRLNQSMPIFCLMNQNNQSLFSISLSELKNELLVTIGVHEESASVKITIETLVPTDDYELLISIIDVPKTWFKVVQEQVNWLYKISEAKLKEIPQRCYEPVLSTWYSFHQNVTDESIVDEAKHYKKLGMNTVILDDGWQTDDGNRRYSYAGEWEVSKNKFPDFYQHIKTIQEMDMSYLLWVSLPYLGSKSSKWEIFKSDLLYYDEFQKAGILDIRSEVVQSYLLETVELLIKNYGIDGLKIDFLETFFSEAVNYYDLSLSILSFFERLEERVDIESDFLIEFRQDYINPLMMQFCNIIRAKDCPNNYLLNRIRTIDLRLSCPHTAIHSDMVMWNRHEQIEDAALHVINTIFSVPQLSMKYDELSKDEVKMIKFWLSFMKKYQAVLLKATFEPFYPQEGYSVVRVSDEELQITAIFNEDKLAYSFKKANQLFINATKNDKLMIKILKGNYQVKTYDCLGNDSNFKKLNLINDQILEFKVPKSGLLIIDME